MLLGRDVPPLSVRCHCAPVSQCPNRSSVCYSTTGCFHSLTLDNFSSSSLQARVIEEHFGCYPNHTNQVDLHCRESIHPPMRMYYCCEPSDGDFCNTKTPLSPLVQHSFKWMVNHKLGSIDHHHNLLHVILVPMFVLFTGLFLIGLLWYYVLRPRLQKLAYAQQIVNPPSSSVPKNPTWLSTVWTRITKPLWFANNHPASLHLSHLRNDEPLLSRHNARSKEEDAYRLTGCTSGSGSGQPHLVQRTIARNIQLEACIGKGRFGEVWRAVCQGELVAVKIFSSRDEASWARETEVYHMCSLHHPNLLAYYASDMISRGGCTQLWLITAYHPRGSLHDYLNRTVLSLPEGLQLARSMSAGLAYLHTEIGGLQAKPAIAHRDIKSKNVLVRSDGQACLADLGLALLYTRPLVSWDNMAHSFCSTFSYGSSVDAAVVNYSGPCVGYSGPSSMGPPQPAGPHVGTKRYMAPEILLTVDIAKQSDGLSGGLCDPSVEPPSECSVVGYLPFEVYQAADIYSMSLVLWELLRCTTGSEPAATEVEGYQIPYQDIVPTDPTFAQMRSVVCSQCASDDYLQVPNLPMEVKPPAMDHGRISNRPPLSTRWLLDPYLKRISDLIVECWHANWVCRLSALRVRKTFESLEAAFHSHHE